MTQEARAITRGPGHHSAGYYDKCPWDVSGRFVLALRSAFCDRSPEADEAAVLGVVDLESQGEGEQFRAFGETRAWNWQQGCMLQWLHAPLAHSRTTGVTAEEAHQVIYNEREGDRFVSVVADALTGREVRRLPLPVYGLSPDGRQAVTLNFSRLHHQRKGYGYAGVADPWERVGKPVDDGIWWMDTRTGEHRLIVTTAQMGQLARKPAMDGAIHRFNHLQWNAAGTRFAFLHRWKQPGAEGPGNTRLAVASPDGSGIAILADEDRVSHYDWRDEKGILAWARVGGAEHFYLIDDPSRRAGVVGADAMPRDGHNSYSPDSDRRWVVNDTYPDAEYKRTLYVYDTATGGRADLGRFYSPPELTQDYRVDLHPRWSRDGRQVCFDSAHEGSRQVYVIDVPDVPTDGA